MTVDSDKSTEELLSDLFGSYKAEWLRERMFGLFTQPSYFPELLTPRPCVLVGGRGTGKTTVLKCLSYEGQLALHNSDPASLPNWPYFGFYYRVNTNRVTAFKGADVPAELWTKAFSHYFNLDLCEHVLRFLLWYEVRCPSQPSLAPSACEAIAASLNIDRCASLRDLAFALAASRLRFEGYINNIHDSQIAKPLLTLQGAPLDTLMDHICLLPHFAGKLFFFLLDEYENFLDDQQQVVNTLIKHASGPYTFKIGVRELGWRRRDTVGSEILISPADYVRIDIATKLGSEDRFVDFARTICNDRLRLLPGGSELDVADILTGLTEEDEALAQGADAIVSARAGALSDTPTLQHCLLGMPTLEAYFLIFWADTHRSDFSSLSAALVSRMSNEREWRTRFENYKFSVLFTLRKGKRGIRKYYSGWSVFAQLAATNIRYLLELVEHTLLRQLKSGGAIAGPISPATQTLAAQAVGRKNISELEGASVHSASITKLLLSLGRVFEVMAADPGGHAPEMNQFHLQDGTDAQATSRADSTLKAAVMNLAILRYPSNKLQDASDTRDYDYTVHPIYAPFFVFSHRKKRKFLLTPALLNQLIDSPKEGIRHVLEQHGRDVALDPLPEQLALFEGFYGGSSG